MGGRATTAGTTFQENVTAWLAVQILAGSARSSRLSLPADVTVDDLVCETTHPIDDIACRLSNGGQLFFQCKTTISLGRRSQEIRKVFDQFARQHLLDKDTNACFFLALSQASSDQSKNELQQLLQKLRDKTGNAGVDTLTALNQSERHLLQLVDHFTDEAFTANGGTLPNDAERAEFYSHIYVLPFDFAEGGSTTAEGIDQLQAIQKLDSRLLVSGKADDAWRLLISIVRGFGPHRTGGNRLFFAQKLVDNGFAVHPDERFEQAIRALKTASRDFSEHVSPHGSISFRSENVSIDRPIINDLLNDLKEQNVLLTGEAGCGKSGCISNLIDQLTTENSDFVLLPVDLIDSANLVKLAGDLRLPTGFGLVDVLEAWTGEGPAFLLVDALDAARTRNGLQTICELVMAVQSRAPRWRIVATIREFDLEKSRQTQRLFGGTLSYATVHPEFEGLRAAHVQRLTDSELAKVEVEIPELVAVLSTAGDSRVRDLAGNVWFIPLMRA